MRFDQLLELFAQQYIPLSHNNEKPKPHKTFYRIDAISTENEFVRNINTAASPALAVSCLVDAHTVSGGKSVEYMRTCYFLCKQVGSLTKNHKQDDEMAAEIKLVSLDNMVIDLLAWLRDYKRKHPNSQSLRGINLQDVEWATIPMKYNGWWVCAVEFQQTVPISPCINEALFINTNTDSNDNNNP